MKASEWAFDRIKEAFELVAKDEVEKMSIVQEIMLRRTDYSRRIITPVGGQGGVTMSYRHNSFPLEDYVWWVSGRKTTKWWCAICGEKYDWRQPNRLLVVQTGESFEQAKEFKAHAVPQGLCANLINALKLLANQQEDLMDGLRDFIRVDIITPWTLRRGTGTKSSEARSSGRGIGCNNHGESG